MDDLEQLWSEMNRKERLLIHWHGLLLDIGCRLWDWSGGRIHVFGVVPMADEYEQEPR